MKLLLKPLLFVISSATQAIACSCAGGLRWYEAYGDASAIFVLTFPFILTLIQDGYSLLALLAQIPQRSVSHEAIFSLSRLVFCFVTTVLIQHHLRHSQLKKENSHAKTH